MNPWKLTPRETEIMDALIKAGCDKQIARDTGISHRTVENHLHAVRRKMGVHSRVLQALMWERYRVSA